jgi:hypothetical protein
MTSVRFSIVFVGIVVACVPDSDSTPPISSGDAVTASPPGADAEPGSPSSSSSPSGPIECSSADECFPQQPGHGTWCGPIEQDFTGASVDPIYVPGTLDGQTAPNGEKVGCRCVKGRCGALLNDGRLVVGPQAEVDNPAHITGGEEEGPPSRRAPAK